MRKYCYAIGFSLLLVSCTGENKQNESTESQNTLPKAKSESVVEETLETIENTVEELNNETEELNNDLDSLINTI